jgi:hypothetical protein
MHDISRHLNALPKTLTDDPQGNLVGLCGEFTHELSQYVDGAGNRPEYYVQMKPHFKVLKAKIEATKPHLHVDDRPHGKGGTNSSQHLNCEVILITGVSLTKVTGLMEQKRIKDLPGEVPYAVYQELVNEFLLEWPKICLDWFVKLEKLTSSFLQYLCDQHFNSYRTYGLRLEVR